MMPTCKRLRRPAILPAAITLLIALAAGGCGGDGGTTPDDPMPAELAAALADLDAVHLAADDLLTALLLADPDTAAALDSAAVAVAADPSVTACQATEQGLAIDHASGLRSAIVFDFADHPEVGLVDARQAPGLPGEQTARPGLDLEKGLVTNPRTGFVNAHYHERQYYADWLLERYDAWFPRVDFHQPERYFDGEATVEKFTFLDGYGVLHLYSHGVLLGGDDIGLMTGEAVNERTTVRYAGDLTDGRLAIIHPRGRADQYAVLPAFVTRYNDFAADSTLVWGGFCYSGLGGWPQALVNDGARGYFGFDWSVYTSMNVAWANSVINRLSDTSGLPATVAQFFASPPLDLSYWNPDAERTVSCLYWGDPEASLWEIEADYDPLDISEVQIHLDGLSAMQEWNDPDPCGAPYEYGIQGYVNRGFRIFGSTTGLVFSAAFQDSDTNWGTVTVAFNASLTTADSLVVHEFKRYDALGYTDELRLTFHDLPLLAVDAWPGGNTRVRFEKDGGTLMPEISVRREQHDSDCVSETTSSWVDSDAHVWLWFVIPVVQ